MKEIKEKTEQETIEYTIVEEDEAAISDDEPNKSSSLMTMHANTTLFGFRCSHENCQESFARLVDLHNHMFYVHNKVKQECPICKLQFATPKLLRLHEKAHGDFACGICGQRFNEKSYLKLHLKNHDSDREEYACHMCKKTFKHKGNLQVHIKSIHEKKKFRCMICDRELSTKQKLDQHMSKRHEVLEDNLEIDLSELERFEKEYANENIQHEGAVKSSKKIKLEPKSSLESKIVDSDEIEASNLNHLSDCNFEFLYND